MGMVVIINNMDTPLSSYEVAKLLKIHPNTVGKWTREGKLSALPRRNKRDCYYYLPETIKDYLAQHNSGVETGIVLTNKTK
jgi:predicted site-specific integrase-resolvase